MPISQRTRQHIDILFAPSERSTAETLLAGLYPISSPRDTERVHFGALRLSRGKVTELAEIVRLDWRDILVGARFGDDVNAHETWVPRLLTLDVVRSWESGHSLEGVEFRCQQSAQLYRGERLPGDPCVILSLLEIEPEPKYRVKCGTGETITVPQSWLRPLATA